MKKKSIALVLALALVVVCIIGGTLAWLTANTDPVTNTFTTSDINITLSETKGGTNHNEFKMIPGWTIEKDPKVTVLTGSEKCYLFVKLEKSANFDTFMTYSMATDWKQLKNSSDADVPGVYYRIVDTTDMGTAYSVLKDDQVAVKDTVTKADMNRLKSANDYPTLTVTAYASQYNSSNNSTFTPAQAWEKVKPQA